MLLSLSSGAYSQQFSGGRIVFTLDGDLYSVHADGSTLVQLTDDGCFNTAVWVSPDGKRLAFSSVSCDDSGFKVLDVATGRIERLTDNFDGLLSPDWTQIAYLHKVESGGNILAFHFDVFLRDVGVGYHDWLSIHLTWSPDGRYLAYEGQFSQRGAYISIYDTAMGKTTQLNVADGLGVDAVPAWSPDSKSLAFLVYNHEMVAHPSGIYVIDTNFDPESARRYDPQGMVEEMVWSPDGTRLVLVGHNAYNEAARVSMYAVHILDLSSGEVQPLDPPNVSGVMPVWSPDGTALVYLSRAANAEGEPPFFTRFSLRLWDGHTSQTIFTPKRGEIIVAPLLWLPED